MCAWVHVCYMCRSQAGPGWAGGGGVENPLSSAMQVTRTWASRRPGFRDTTFSLGVGRDPARPRDSTLDYCWQIKCEKPWSGSSVGWWAVPLLQGLGFNPPSGHIQQATKGGIIKWNDTSMFLSLLPLFLKSINTI